MPGDFEMKLVERLARTLTQNTGLKVKPIAGALPPDLPERSLQSVNVGGRVGEPGIAYPALSLHVRSRSEAETVRLANALPAAVWQTDAERINEDGVNVVHVGLASSPYANFDPINPEFFRYSCQVVLTLKIGK